MVLQFATKLLLFLRKDPHTKAYYSTAPTANIDTKLDRYEHYTSEIGIVEHNI